MRKLLLATAGLMAFAALPALAGQPAPTFSAGFGVAANGSTAQTGNYAYTAKTTTTNDNVTLVNPAQSSAQSGGSFSLGAGATPAVWASNPNGTVGQLLNPQGPSSSQGGPASFATASSNGFASNTSQSITSFSVSLPPQQNNGPVLTSFSEGGHTSAVPNITAGATLQNTATSSSTHYANENASSSGLGAYALNSGVTGATGQSAAGLLETTSTQSQATGSTGWATGTQNFAFAANANGFADFNSGQH